MFVILYLKLLTPKVTNNDMTILNKKDVVVGFTCQIFTEGLLG